MIKKMSRMTARGCCAALMLSSLGLGAARPAAVQAADKAAKDPMVFCPMMDISVKKSKAFKSSYKGRTYYVCCKMCKAAFDKNPAKSAAMMDKKLAARARAQKAGGKKAS